MRQLSPAMTIRFLLLILLVPSAALAQTTADRNFEERYRILNSKLELLMESMEAINIRQQELEMRLNELVRETARAKDENARSSLQSVTRDELKALAEKIQEVDRKREADNRLILESLKDLAKAPAGAIATPKPATVDDTEKYKYTVKSGENLFAIITAYNDTYKAEGRKTISLDDVKRANPGLNPDLIREGQTIYIPIPKKR